MTKQCIIVGGGSSIEPEWRNGLFDKIRGHEIWSINSAFKTMTYYPNKELFVDKSFFEKNVDALEHLYKNGVEIICKRHVKTQFIGEMKQFNTTRNINEYYGENAIIKNLLFVGSIGLSGFFALSYAIASGYNRIWLLGFDFGSGSVTDTNTHFYQKEMKDLNIYSTGVGRPNIYRPKDGSLHRAVNDFEVYTKHPGVEIWNVSPQSNIACFPKINYQEFYTKINE
jgi:hypothetical protein